MAGITHRISITGAKETERAFERLARESPRRARAASNRTVGVARARVIKTLARITGVPQNVIGGRRGGRRGGGRVKGRGYIKLVRATRRRQQAGLVGLVEGIRFSRLKRKTLGRSQRKPGGVGQPFRATMGISHDSLFERVSPQSRISRGATENTRRFNLPIREVVIPMEPHATRAILVHMRRAARSVYPKKIWEELQKSIKPVRR